MEVLNLIRLFWGWVFPYISLTCLVIDGMISEAEKLEIICLGGL